MEKTIKIEMDRDEALALVEALARGCAVARLFDGDTGAGSVYDRAGSLSAEVEAKLCAEYERLGATFAYGFDLCWGARDRAWEFVRDMAYFPSRGVSVKGKEAA